MTVIDSSPLHRCLTLSRHEVLDSADVVEFLQSEGYTQSYAEEKAAQMFDLLEGLARSLRSVVTA